MKNQLWRHALSGERYVVVINDSNDVVGASDALHYNEIDTALRGDFDVNDEVTEDIKNNIVNYVLVR